MPACLWHQSVEMICGRSSTPPGGCQTVLDGQYATAVTIYNPTTCPVTIVKHFAPLVLSGDVVGREPHAVQAQPSPS